MTSDNRDTDTYLQYYIYYLRTILNYCKKTRLC